jgi:hypothetical protein
MRGLIINADVSSVNLHRRRMKKIVDKPRKLEQTLDRQLLGPRRCDTRGWRVPIGPFTPNGNAAASRFAQDQRLAPAHTPRFKDGESLTTQGMEGVPNLSPSQRLVGNLGSSR